MGALPLLSRGQNTVKVRESSKTFDDTGVGTGACGRHIVGGAMRGAVKGQAGRGSAPRPGWGVSAGARAVGGLG
ncbi:hypothetical protein GCM10010230_01790 [Streptomyces narbonensis]|nr:hypothetical protein GCM10010230_01790 [Streptomyces narbonensis]